MPTPRRQPLPKMDAPPSGVAKFHRTLKPALSSGFFYSKLLTQYLVEIQEVDFEQETRKQ